MNDRTAARLKLTAMLAVAGVHMPTLPAQPAAAAPPRRPAPRQEVVIERVTLPLPETRQQRRKRARDLAKRARSPR